MNNEINRMYVHKENLTPFLIYNVAWTGNERIFEVHYRSATYRQNKRVLGLQTKESDSIGSLLY